MLVSLHMDKQVCYNIIDGDCIVVNMKALASHIR